MQTKSDKDRETKPSREQSRSKETSQGTLQNGTLQVAGDLIIIFLSKRRICKSSRDLQITAVVILLKSTKLIKQLLENYAQQQISPVSK